MGLPEAEAKSKSKTKKKKTCPDEVEFCSTLTLELIGNMTMLEIDQMNVKLFSKVCEGKSNETILSSGLIHDPCVKCAQKPPCKKLRKCLKKLEAGSPSTPAPTLQSFSSDDSASSKKMTKNKKNKKIKTKKPKKNKNQKKQKEKKQKYSDLNN